MSLDEFSARKATKEDLRFLKRAGLIVEEDDALRLCSQMQHWLASGEDDGSLLIGVIHSRVKFVGELLAELENAPKTMAEVRSTANTKYGLNWGATAQVDRRLRWLEFAGLVERQNSRRILTPAGQAFLSRLKIHRPGGSSREPRYWLMSLGPNARFWDECYESGIACLGWDDLGNLQQYESREEIAAKGLGRNDSLACWAFCREMNVGDVIFSKRTRLGAGQAIGHGIVRSVYRIDPTRTEYRNVRDVEWHSNFSEGVKVRDEATVVKTLTDITEYPSLVQQIKIALGIVDDPKPRKPYSINTVMDEGSFFERTELEQLESRLKRKNNLILQGPPGTGKTWLAKRLAYALIGERDASRVCAIQFHPTLSYEDFVCGWRPSGDGLELADGIFLRAVEAALAEPDAPFVIVIEEINRGNPAQIFGELITLIEADKRTPEESIELAYTGDGRPRLVYVPENLYVLGTMNIADRSLALVDLALRRRFAFATLEPKFGTRWRQWVIDERGVAPELAARIERKMVNLNNSIAGTLGAQFKVGHSYVTPTRRLASGETRQWFSEVVETEIVPLLEEYWFDDDEQVEKARAELLANW